MTDAIMQLDLPVRKYVEFAETEPQPGMRLGRHQHLDPRSLAYTASEGVATAPIKPASHDPVIGILDQSDLHSQGIHLDGDPDELGSCTGNAGTYAVSALYKEARHVGVLLNEKYAIELYHRATLSDNITGTWPPTDAGSSGLGVCRALKKSAVIGGYHWATDLPSFARLFRTTGVLLGTPWFEEWFDPDTDGFIDDGTPADWGRLVGGHELYAARLEIWDERHPERSVIAGPNSWSDSWGDEGWWRMRLSTYLRLRRYIDVKQLQPL